MTGIDQVFLHYVHPLAVTIIVAMFCQLARISYTNFQHLWVAELFVLHVFPCYYCTPPWWQLLYCYWDHWHFYNINKVYTYLSPDIEYFHGRHLPYFIVAVLCLLVIVFGLPLFLLLEPFLNHKINFIKFKPLLDQFQGFCRDKYHLFAAYNSNNNC